MARDRGAGDADAALHRRAAHRQPVSAPGHHRLDPWLEAQWLETADKKPVKNEELWKRLDAALGRHKIEWKWVKGHAGDAMNERADALARAGMAPFKPGR